MGGHLKNLVIDKPAPITVKLAQIEKSDGLKLAQTEGTPITVNPESIMRENTMAKARLGLNKVRVGPDEFNLVREMQPMFNLMQPTQFGIHHSTTGLLTSHHHPMPLVSMLMRILDRTLLLTDTKFILDRRASQIDWPKSFH